MNLDYILSRFNSFSLNTEGLTSENLPDKIKKDFVHTNGAETLFLVMPTWADTIKYLGRAKNQVVVSGASFLAYDFPRAILSNNYNLTKNCFDKVNELVRNEISNLKKQYGYTSCVIIGGSLGAVYALMVANGNEDINRTVLIVPSNCLAEAMWKGCRTQHLRKAYEKQGISLKQLKEFWYALAPENNLNLEDKSISVYLSKTDSVIPYKLGKALVKKMKGAGLNLNKYLGHYLTLIYFYLFPERFLDL